jgi:hypothetical protein
VKRLLATVALLLPAIALADVDLRFSRLRDAAEPLGSLDAFLNRYIGQCADVFASADCRTKADAFRKAYKGKKLYMIVDEDVADMVTPGPYQPVTGDFVVNILPFFPAGSYALSHGTPKKTNSEGNPVLPLLTVSARAPKEWNGQYYSRLFTSQMVRVQVVFTPLDIWSLERPKGGKIYGVSARMEGILLTEGRTGVEMGLWLDGKDANKLKKK